MGRNLASVCHSCRVKIFHLRGKEGKTMLPFYKDHTECMRSDSNNVETKDDQLQQEGWMDDDGYKDVID